MAHLTAIVREQERRYQESMVRLRELNILEFEVTKFVGGTISLALLGKKRPGQVYVRQQSRNRYRTQREAHKQQIQSVARSLCENAEKELARIEHVIDPAILHSWRQALAHARGARM